MCRLAVTTFDLILFEQFSYVEMSYVYTFARHADFQQHCKRKCRDFFSIRLKESLRSRLFFGTLSGPIRRVRPSAAYGTGFFFFCSRTASEERKILKKKKKHPNTPAALWLGEGRVGNGRGFGGMAQLIRSYNHLCTDGDYPSPEPFPGAPHSRSRGVDDSRRHSTVLCSRAL